MKIYTQVIAGKKCWILESGNLSCISSDYKFINDFKRRIMQLRGQL